jgi:hypothetical protein
MSRSEQVRFILAIVCGLTAFVATVTATHPALLPNARPPVVLLAVVHAAALALNIGAFLEDYRP